MLKYEVDQGHGRIAIGSGPDQGVQVGMVGVLLSGSHEIADFTVETAEGRVCTAHVHATQDQVNGASGVVIKGSSAPESQEGKEF